MADALSIKPVRLPTPSAWDVSRRVAIAVGHASRHLVSARRRGDFDDQAKAVVVRKTFDDLGGTFTKFGQLIASSPGLFGGMVSDEFRGCLDEGPPVPFWALKRAIERDLGQPVDELFASIDREPIAAASLAVVHRAELPDGQPVAVKVLRPGIRRSLATDLAALGPIADFLGRQVAIGISGSLPGLVRGLREQVAEEVDLRNEARAILWFRSLLMAMDADLIRVPEPVESHCGTRVLTMELIEGVPVDHAEAIADMGVDPRPALTEALRAWFGGLLAVGAFHGDIHAGNLLICPDGKMGVLDWGIVGRVDAGTAQFLRRTLEAVLGDESGWEDAASYIRSQLGDGVADMVGVDEASWTPFVRGYLEPLFSSPIGEVDLREMLLRGGIGDVQGMNGTRRNGLAGTLEHWWSERRRMRAVMASDGFGGEFDRSTFLLGKQLVYFERYGKQYLPDVPLLDNPDAYRALLEVVAASHTGGSDGQHFDGAAPSDETLRATSKLLR